MKKIYRQSPIIALCTVLICCSCVKENKSILNETFDSNTRGWVEEISEHHDLYIENGKYYIESKDTSSLTFRTSTGSLDRSYLFGLPNKYEIETKLQLKNNELDDVHYGLILKGAAYEYSFNLYKSGIIKVLQYDYNSEMESTLLSDTSAHKIENEIKLKIIVDGTDFILFVDDYEIGRSKFNVKCWQGLRVFTSKQSQIVVDYITIKAVVE